ncbi:MAG TPA: 2'-5' RNA ligase family protein [Allosphingosinicella sp.]|jgi:2'-5' RNA ligase
MIYSYAYLFMLLPSPRERERIAATTGLVGPMRSLILRHQLHMSLAEIADLPERCLEMAAIARRALANHRLRACTFALGRLAVEPGIARLETIGRRAELNALRSDLTDLLLAAGMPPSWRKTFAPHVTLGRGVLSRDRRPIDPIFWHADRIALIESWRGETRHEILETWPLLPPIQGRFDFGLAA